jgi:hypothetical protein
MGNENKNLIRGTAGLFLSLAIFLVTGCASTQKEEAAVEGEEAQVAEAPVKGSSDILELLTGFGESVSRRNFDRAVAYLVPEERAKILDANGKVPENRQKDLMALPLQRLIRTPTVKVENNFLSGIYDQLPSNRLKAEAKDSASATDEAASPSAASN